MLGATSKRWKTHFGRIIEYPIRSFKGLVLAVVENFHFMFAITVRGFPVNSKFSWSLTLVVCFCGKEQHHNRGQSSLFVWRVFPL